MDATLRGASGCVIVDGPFGVGKTHLLKATALEGAKRGLCVVAGRASITHQPITVNLLINFLRHVMHGEADFDDLARPDRNPFWLIDRVGELVEAAARRQPLVVALDDVHRIDDVSALALRGLVQSLASSPVLWLLARRPVSTQSLAQHAVDWLHDHAAVRLQLRALDDAAVAEVCGAILGARPDASVLDWAARCGGNPRLMEHVFNALIKAGQMIIANGTARVVVEHLPEGVLTCVRGLLDEMSPAVARLLVECSGIGRTFTLQEAAALLGEPALELSAGVDEAVQVGLLRRNSPQLTFVHRVIWEALEHAEFQRPQTTAPFTGPSAVPDLRPSPAAVTDSRPARPVAAPVAVLPAPAPPQPSGCSCADVVTRAISSLEGIFYEVPRTLARALRLLAATGRVAEACGLADIALRSGIEASLEAHLVLEVAQGLREADRHGMAADLLRRTLARQDVSELHRAKLNRTLADVATRAGTTPAAAGAHRPGQPPAACCTTDARPLWTWLVRALVASDQFEEAAAALDAVKQHTEELGDALPAALWLGHRAELLTAAGRLDEARIEAETALRLTERSTPQDCVPARLVLAHISVHRGDLASASDQLRMTERLMTGDAAADQARLDWALAQFHAVSGRPAMMVQTLINVEGQVRPDPLLFTEAPTAAATLVRHARQAGLGAEAERAAEFARRIARCHPLAQSLVGGAEHAEGLLRNDVVALNRAADLYRLAGRQLAAGSALEDAAQVEPGGRDKTRTVRLLESAMGLYQECGAQGDVERVQRKLRRLDAQNVRRLGPERPKSGWESITTAELRVVRAIVDGMTNREAASVLFLSPHTVDTHLRRVFSKLDINSRVELTKHFIAHETFPPAMAGAQQHRFAG
ncbi:LuxR C-terminal-related transcriptional regulator [Dactylosporangium sp. NBC_01737]|uniref:LuxR C-terminal-related transcriptional regulator n=1 Tax=Dactylosporangium sp. NBC_01737 TaxID=2975959 RepID=UPI002E0E4175|nr:LuxR C-terminal-related transcriptional regulator [Dactylosporangium sp. NBC_01737]